MVWTKEKLRQDFAKDPKRYYEVELFKREGFTRSICPKCGKGYWSLGKEDCGDPSHTPYSFFRETPRRMRYSDFWNKYAEFFEKRGHAVINRYPVLSRWRDDLYFTIASIVDFQRLEEGRIVFEYPANPLIVPQMCLRFGDVANIGVTGRHMSCFMMAGQHAFNPPKEGYWKDECMQYNYEYFREVLGIPKEEIVYGEDVWNMPDFSAFGPCIETFSKGSELANSVFMQYYIDGGPTGSEMKDLPMKVIDVGWGFDRLLWYHTGDSTVYDAVFPKEIEWMKSKTGLRVPKELFDKYARLSATLDVETVRNQREEKEKIAKLLGISLPELEKTIAPLQAIYAIADHSRALLFAFTDGALPSNTAGGYNLRVLARRAFGFINEYNFDFELYDLLVKQAEELKDLFPELKENLPTAQKILEAEKRKYGESLEKTKRAAREVIAKGQAELTAERLTTLYESQGVTPELLERAARDAGKPIEIPTDYYRKVAEKHLMEEVKKKPTKFKDLAATKLVYYDDPELLELEAKVLAKEDKAVVLDQTIFYPEGGGQDTDKGWLDETEVFAAEKAGALVIHHLKDSSKISVGQTVKLKLNSERRMGLRRHHTATHLLTGTCRKILGPQAWQAGAKKEENIAHLDITHYARLSPEQKREIEQVANNVVSEARTVTVRERDRGEAEKVYGFRLYQGGGAIGKRIRIVNIQDWDTEACGGLHVSNTKDIGLIKIVGTEQVQDGVIRLYFKVGPAAVQYSQESDELLEKTSKVLNVTREKLPQTVERFFEEWKERGKKIEKLQELLAENLAYRLLSEAKQKGQKRIETSVPLETSLVEKLVLTLSKEAGVTAIVRGEAGFVAVACNSSSPDSALEVLKGLGAKGGGSKDFARGKVL